MEMNWICLFLLPVEVESSEGDGANLQLKENPG